MHYLLTAMLLFIASTSGSTAETRTLRGGVPAGLPGYTMGADGTLIVDSPFKRRILECIEKVQKVQIVWQAYPTKRVEQMLIDGRLDLAFPMGFTSERAGRMLQTHPTWKNPDNWLSMRPLDINDKTLRIATRLGSPQQVDHVADGYTNVIGTYTYTELVRTVVQGRADAAIVPQSVYEDMDADWPKETKVTVGRARNSGFYLNATDPKGLLTQLNSAIDRCRTPEK